MIRKEEVSFSKTKLKGKLGAKIYKYGTHLDKIIASRLAMFITAIFVFLDILSNYVFHDSFLMELFIERFVCSIILIIAGLLFNKLRTVSILLAIIPTLYLLHSYFFFQENFSVYRVGITAAMLIVIGSGIYYDYQAKKIRKELVGLLKSKLDV